MVEIKFAVAEGQQFSPTVRDIIKAAAQAVWGEDETFELTPHPAGPGVVMFGDLAPDGILTYSPAQIATASDALSLLTQTFKIYDGQVTLPELRYEVLTSTEKLRDLGDRVVVDIETKGDIDGPPSERQILSVGIWDGTDKPVYIISAELFYANIGRIRYALEKREIIAHNSKFDLKDLNYHLESNLRAWADSLVLHYCMHPGAGHKLKILARMYLGVPDWEADIKKYLKGKDYSTIPFENLARYNAADVYYTGILLIRLHNIATPDALRFYKQRMIDSRFLQDIEEGRGVHLDLDYFQRLDADYTTRLEQMKADLAQMVGDENFNPGSPAQVKKALASMGHVLTSTDVKTLTPLKDEIPFVGALLDYRGEKKLHGTYVQGMLKRQRDGFVHPGFSEVGTITGRLASTNPNIQNIPRKSPIKQGIDCPPGYVIVTADYSQVEARVMACMSEDKEMQAAFQPDSEDFFDLLMPTFFPKEFPTLDDYLAYKASVGGEDKVYRAKGKGVIYGLAFGREARAIGIALGMDEKGASGLIGAYARKYPVMWEWREEMKAKALRGELVSKFGMLFEREIITAYNMADIERSALSFTPQHHANQLLVNGVRKTHEQIKAQGLDAWVHALVHDAGYLYVRADQAELVAKMLQTNMEEAGSDVFGDLVVFSAVPVMGYNWEHLHACDACGHTPYHCSKCPDSGHACKEEA